jgi:cathepsin L
VFREELRRAIFDANVHKVNRHNLEGHSWTMAINEYADLTSREFAIGRIGGYLPRRLRTSRAQAVSEVRTDLPSSVDWVSAGAVTAVKNQGQCGSCWAFSTTGSVEGAHEISTKTLVSLSEQELVDCSSAEGNQGCNGGLMDQAFQYIIKNGGICTYVSAALAVVCCAMCVGARPYTVLVLCFLRTRSEASYPYKGVDGSCKKSCTKAATISSFTDVTVNSDSALATAVAKNPVSVAIEADQSSFQLYSGGVLTAACGTQLDHGVLAVGYGTASGVEYWKVKNSWGASWGEQGYVRLARGSSYNGGAGQCGIYSDPSYPVV